MITQTDVQFFKENGYFVAHEALSAEEVAELRQETVNICRGKRGEVTGLPEFGTDETDDEVIARTLCIHFPHKISEVMMGYIKHPALVEVLTGVVSPDVKCMQSMLFIKSAGKPGQAWHQDEDFIPTRDRSLIGAWIALDDATVENGCLWIIPGSHKHGILWEMQEQHSDDFDCSDESVGFPYTDADSVPVEVKAGSIVFFNGYTLHRSLPNVAESGYRRALVNHYMSASSLLPWRPPGADDPQMALMDHRDVIMVAGKDPYAWKGYTDVMRPHIRRSREGGCKLPNEDESTPDRDTLNAVP